MNTAVGPEPLTGSDIYESQAIINTKIVYKRYANILRFLRDDIQSELKGVNLPSDGQLNRLVAQRFEVHFTHMEWEEAVVKLLQAFAESNEANAKVFCHYALSRIKTFKSDSYIWLH